MPSPATASSGDNLRIDRVTCRSSRQPLRSPFRTALREVRELEAVEVTVDWSDGSTTRSGVSPTPPITGETAGSIEAAVTGPLAAAVVGVALAHHEELFRRLHAALRANTTAKCAIDLAIHAALAPGGDIAGYLGAGEGPARTDMTVSLADAATMAADAAKRVAEGFDLLKLKVGGDDTDLDLARVQAVAETVGPDIALRLDANQGWTPKGALAVLDGLERRGIHPELVEQPVAARDLAGMATVARHSQVPVLADESVHSAADVVRVAEAGAADLINVKLAKCGGLRAARDVIATAQACDLGVIVGCMLEPATTVAAAAALALTLPTTRGHDLDAGWWVDAQGPVRYAPPFLHLRG